MYFNWTRIKKKYLLYGTKLNELYKS